MHAWWKLRQDGLLVTRSLAGVILLPISRRTSQGSATVAVVHTDAVCLVAPNMYALGRWSASPWLVSFGRVCRNSGGLCWYIGVRGVDVDGARPWSSVMKVIGHA